MCRPTVYLDRPAAVPAVIEIQRSGEGDWRDNYDFC
jgi:hypothetical protein